MLIWSFLRRMCWSDLSNTFNYFMLFSLSLILVKFFSKQKNLLLVTCSVVESQFFPFNALYSHSSSLLPKIVIFHICRLRLLIVLTVEFDFDLRQFACFVSKVFNFSFGFFKLVKGFQKDEVRFNMCGVIFEMTATTLANAGQTSEQLNTYVVVESFIDSMFSP